MGWQPLVTYCVYENKEGKCTYGGAPKTFFGNQPMCVRFSDDPRICNSCGVRKPPELHRPSPPPPPPPVPKRSSSRSDYVGEFMDRLREAEDKNRERLKELEKEEISGSARPSPAPKEQGHRSDYMKEWFKKVQELGEQRDAGVRQSAKLLDEESVPSMMSFPTPSEFVSTKPKKKGKKGKKGKKK